MIKRASIFNLIFIFSLILSGADETSYKKARDIEIGFADSFKTISAPEKERLFHIGSTVSIGFPWNCRSVGIMQKKPVEIEKLIIRLVKLGKEFKDEESSMAKGFSIYESDDNKNYRLVNADYKTQITHFSRGGDYYEQIEIEGLRIKSKYIKIFCPGDEKRCIFGTKSLLEMIEAFSRKKVEMSPLKVPRFIRNELKVNCNLKFLSAVPSATARILMQSGEKQEDAILLWDKKINAPVDEFPISTEFNLDKYPVGKKYLILQVLDQKNEIISESKSAFCLCGSESSGKMAFLYPDKNGKLEGNWEKRNAELPGMNLAYIEAKDDKNACYSTPAEEGYWAVYAGMIGEDSRALLTMSDGEKKEIKLEAWQSNPENKAVFGEAFAGLFKFEKDTVLKIGRTPAAPLRFAYIRTVRMTPEQIRLFKEKVSTERRIILHNDGYSDFCFNKLNSVETLRKMIDEAAAAPIYSYDWCIGTTTLYNIKTGKKDYFGCGTKYWREYDRTAGKIVKGLIESGINPLEIIAGQARRDKLHLNVTLRMNACYNQPSAEVTNGPFYNDNPQYRIITPGGIEISRLSYAYPEVRGYLISLLKTILETQIDGIHLQYLRDPPFFGYDKPLIEAYRNKFGSFSPENYMDEKWQSLQCEIMSDFVKKVRTILDEKSKDGRRLTLSVSFDCEDYYRQGLDVKRWIKEGLVDLISPGKYGIRKTDMKMFSLSPFTEITGETHCLIFPYVETMVIGGDPTPEEEKGLVKILRTNLSINQYKKIFLDFYQDGAQGIYPFNPVNPILIADELADMRKLRIWQEFEEPFISWFSQIEK